MRTKSNKAFTIIELLVVVSIIALLIGILLPAIGKARDRAYVTRSQSNLRQIGIAHANYAAEHNDNQWSAVPHTLAQYGPNETTAVSNYLKAFDKSPKSLPMASGGVLSKDGKAAIHLGFAYNQSTGATEDWWWSHPSHHGAVLPISFAGSAKYAKAGSFMFINNRKFNPYLSGRFYDPVFYAPKDRMVLSALGECADAPGEYCLQTDGPFLSSYVLSPAAMFNPDFMRYEGGSHSPGMGTMFQAPATLRSPTFSQARYPDLKTHMLEHHWLQNARRDCRSPILGNYTWQYNGCQPYFFNGSRDSIPVTLFYDGHVDLLSHREVRTANERYYQQTADTPLGSHYLYHTNTQFGAAGYWAQNMYAPKGADKAIPFKAASYHILTTDGIRGRDKLSR